MSRIGKLPVEIPSGVEVNLSGRDLAVKGPKGQLSLTLVTDVTASKESEGVVIQPRDPRTGGQYGLRRDNGLHQDARA